MALFIAFAHLAFHVEFERNLHCIADKCAQLCEEQRWSPTSRRAAPRHFWRFAFRSFRTYITSLLYDFQYLLAHHLSEETHRFFYFRIAAQLCTLMHCRLPHSPIHRQRVLYSQRSVPQCLWVGVTLHWVVPVHWVVGCRALLGACTVQRLL